MSKKTPHQRRALLWDRPRGSDQLHCCGSLFHTGDALSRIVQSDEAPQRYSASRRLNPVRRERSPNSSVIRADVVHDPTFAGHLGNVPVAVDLVWNLPLRDIVQI